jgi:hypothetical protein
MSHQTVNPAVYHTLADYMDGCLRRSYACDA